MSITRWVPILTLAALPLVGCQPQQTEEEPAAEETAPSVEQDAEMAPATEPAAEPGDTMEEQVSVDNQMPHAMVVSVLENGESRELGTVEASQTQEFTIEGAEGAQMELVAEDTEQTHSVNTMVQVGAEPSTWTLGG